MSIKHYIAAASIAITSIISPASSNFNDISLEESLKNCTEHGYDGLLAQRRFWGKCVTYINFERERLVVTYTPITPKTGYLTFIPGDPSELTEKIKVRVMPSLPNIQYREVRGVKVNFIEKTVSRVLFNLYKTLLTKK